MKTTLSIRGEITEEGKLKVELPPDLPRGRVLVTLDVEEDNELDVAEEDLRGDGQTAEQIARAPEIGAWADDPEVPSGQEYVERIRRPPMR